MERCTVFAFLDADFITAIERRLRELKRTARRQPHRSALEGYSQERPTRHHVLPPPHYFSEKVGVDCCVLYVPEVEDFPLLDAFFCGLKSEDAGWAADGYGGWAPHPNQHCEA
ncbi:retrotransposon hot spot (RHS) protein, partial [Trypanosoma cruzi]